MWRNKRDIISNLKFVQKGVVEELAIHSHNYPQQCVVAPRSMTHICKNEKNALIVSIFCGANRSILSKSYIYQSFMSIFPHYR